MFTAYRERLRIEKKGKNQEYAQTPQAEELGDSIERFVQPETSHPRSISDSPAIVESEEIESQKDDQNAFLSHVFLQKSPYVINGKVVEQIEDQVFDPVCFVDAIKDFESG